MRKVRLEEYGTMANGAKMRMVKAVDTGCRIFCHRDTTGDQACFDHCSAFDAYPCIETNDETGEKRPLVVIRCSAMRADAAIGELVEDGEK